MAVHLDGRSLILGECGHWWQVDSPPGAIATCPRCSVAVDFTELATWAEAGENCNCTIECEYDEADCSDSYNEGADDMARAVSREIDKVRAAGVIQGPALESVLEAIGQAESNCC